MTSSDIVTPLVTSFTAYAGTTRYFWDESQLQWCIEEYLQGGAREHLKSRSLSDLPLLHAWLNDYCDSAGEQEITDKITTSLLTVANSFAMVIAQAWKLEGKLKGLSEEDKLKKRIFHHLGSSSKRHLITHFFDLYLEKTKSGPEQLLEPSLPGPTPQLDLF